MTSQKQIDANRLNSQKSTGPRTPAGKSIVATNAFKHGIFAESPAIIGENTDDFATLKQSLYLRFLPATPDEEILVATITRNAWLLERFSNIEVQLWDFRLNRIDPNDQEDSANPLAVAHRSISQSLSFLQRRIDSADRAYRRNLECLLKLQSARPKTAPEPVPAPAPQPEAIKQLKSPEPTGALARLAPETGFVHANPVSTPPAPTRPRVTFPILGHREAPVRPRPANPGPPPTSSI